MVVIFVIIPLVYKMYKFPSKNSMPNLKRQYRHDQSRLPAGHGIDVLV